MLIMSGIPQKRSRPMKKWIIQEVDVNSKANIVLCNFYTIGGEWFGEEIIPLIDPSRIKQLDYIIEPEE